MAHHRRTLTADALRAPHAVSLKVLRLSQPSLATQIPLPNAESIGLSPKASLAYPGERTDDKGILSPVLTLPEAFGSAHVGETFSCTLCANNELDLEDETRVISAVRIQADMQTPSTPSGSPLNLSTGSTEDAHDDVLQAGDTLQKILRFELKEEGNHVLAVTVTYTETLIAGEGQAAGGRVRTFRKLYQFVAQQLLSVRTKAGPRRNRPGLGQYLLEAQIENTGDGAVSLEEVLLNAKPPLRSTPLGLNALGIGKDGEGSAPVLNARDVLQVAFLLEERIVDAQATDAATDRQGASDGKRTLGQLEIQWRGAHGDRGSLSTGWLTSRS